MRKVFKYTFGIVDEFTLDIPEGSEMLSVQTQGDKPCLWALVYPNQEKEERTFKVFGTGRGIEEGRRESLEYISTIQMNNGLVWHIFESIAI